MPAARINEATYYDWKAKYGGRHARDAKKLNHVVADLTLDHPALKNVLSRDW